MESYFQKITESIRWSFAISVEMINRNGVGEKVVDFQLNQFTTETNMVH